MFLKWTLYSCYFLLTLILVLIFSNQLMKTVFNLVSSIILICKINKPLLIFMSFLPENLLSCFPTSHSLWLRNPAHSLITLGRPSPSLLWVPLFNDYSCSSCLRASYWLVCLEMDIPWGQELYFLQCSLCWVYSTLGVIKSENWDYYAKIPGFLKFIYLSNSYTQCGARTHDAETHSHTLF